MIYSNMGAVECEKLAPYGTTAAVDPATALFSRAPFLAGGSRRMAAQNNAFSADDFLAACRQSS